MATTTKDRTAGMTFTSIASAHRRGVALALIALTLTLLTVLARPAASHAAFGLQPGSFVTSLSNTQAGGHPDLRTAFVLNQNADRLPDGTLKDLHLELPPGLSGDPGAAPRCSMQQVMTPAFDPCPMDTAVGSAKLTLGFPIMPGFVQEWTVLIYNVEPYRDSVASMGFNALFNARIDVRLRPDGEYGLSISSTDISEGATVLGIDMTIWGVPVDQNGPGSQTDQFSQRSFGGPNTGARRPFLTNATSCNATDGQSNIAVTSWQHKTTVHDTTTFEKATGCDRLSFEPEVRVRPDTFAPGVPAGYAIDVDIPQDESPDGLATAHLRDARVVLPEGVTLSPSAADGLEGCTSEQVGLRTLRAPACPRGSRIGSVSVTTPVLPGPLVGDVYLGQPLPGNRYRMFLAVAGHGADVKLEGRIDLHPQTGQVTTRFLQNPQLPFSNLHMELKGGPRAPLANPATCGAKTTTSELTSWAGHSVSPSDSFEITGCPARTFAPTWSVGTTNPVAGADTAFTLRATRNDNDHEIDSINASLPPGLLGRISRVRPCSAAQAAVATCDSSSQVGTTTVGAGPGSSPFYLKGRVYLTEGYKGAPYGMAFVVPAIAGPYDLGIVNVRASLNVDRTTAEVSVASDPLPRILDGIPLRIKDLRVDIDRPGFMVNPTRCAPMQILGRINSVVPGVVGSVSNRFQVGECAALPLKPELAMTLDGKGETTDGDHPSLRALLKQTPGQTNMRKAAVTLPLSLALDPDNAQALCKPQEAAARACPAGSIVGSATAVTPILSRPLSGPVYFVEGLRRTASGATRRTLPKLWIPLKGEVELDLNADTTVVDDKLVTSFANIPDAPITSFELNIAGGKNGVIVVSNADVCAANQQATGDYTGQSGKTLLEEAAQITPLNCSTKIMKATQSGTSVKLTVGGLRNGGRVSVTGEDVQTTRRTLKSANAANLTVPLDTTARRKLVRNKRLEVKVSVSYRATGSRRTKRMSKTLTLKYPAPAAQDETASSSEARKAHRR